MKIFVIALLTLALTQQHASAQKVNKLTRAEKKEGWK
ncbi:MAG: hypothetical protein JWR67_1112, partial [Mucilaginibacter sp.]|nr:hypothetical protein [Mucilaginibacter sp.]